MFYGVDEIPLSRTSNMSIKNDVTSRFFKTLFILAWHLAKSHPSRGTLPCSWPVKICFFKKHWAQCSQKVKLLHSSCVGREFLGCLGTNRDETANHCAKLGPSLGSPYRDQLTSRPCYYRCLSELIWNIYIYLWIIYLFNIYIYNVWYIILSMLTHPHVRSSLLFPRNAGYFEPPTSPGCCMPSCSRPRLRPSCRCQRSRPPVLPRHQEIHNRPREHLDVLLESHLGQLDSDEIPWIPGWIVCRTAETPGRHSSGTVRSHLPLSSPRPAQGRSTWRRVLDLWKIWIPPLHLSEMNPWKTNLSLNWKRSQILL